MAAVFWQPGMFENALTIKKTDRSSMKIRSKLVEAYRKSKTVSYIAQQDWLPGPTLVYWPGFTVRKGGAP
jgi:hypothetical protein